MKKTYNIPVMWSCSGVHQIEAESLEEAIKIAEESKMPSKSEYVFASYEVDYEGIEGKNPEIFNLQEN